MAIALSTLELDILRKLLNGEAVSLSSQLRLRLELAGAIREGPSGVRVTEAGRRLAGKKPPAVADDQAPVRKVARDARGRRMPFQRRSVF